MTVVDTPRLLLRRLTPEDAPFILRLLNEPSFLRWIGDRNVRNLDDARKYIEDGPMASYDRHGFGLFLTALRDGTPIGMCGLLRRDALPDVDIGFAFLPEYWSQGYAFEASSAVLAWGRGTVGLTRIVAVVTPGNEPSIRLLGKLGMRFEGMVRLAQDSADIKLFA